MSISRAFYIKAINVLETSISCDLGRQHWGDLGAAIGVHNCANSAVPARLFRMLEVAGSTLSSDNWFFLLAEIMFCTYHPLI